MGCVRHRRGEGVSWALTSLASSLLAEQLAALQALAPAAQGAYLASSCGLVARRGERQAAGAASHAARAGPSRSSATSPRLSLPCASARA